MAKAYNFNFMSYRKPAAVASVILVLVSFASLVTRSLEWGLDFTGGTLVEVTYEEVVSPSRYVLNLTRQGIAATSCSTLALIETSWFVCRLRKAFRIRKTRD